MTWIVYVAQKRERHKPGDWPRRERYGRLAVTHCMTVAQAVRTAQRRYPGWTAVAAEKIR